MLVGRIKGTAKAVEAVFKKLRLEIKHFFIQGDFDKFIEKSKGKGIFYTEKLNFLLSGGCFLRILSAV